jgi:hypothetical protein
VIGIEPHFSTAWSRRSTRTGAHGRRGLSSSGATPPLRSCGGSGLEACLRRHFPRVEAVILDFYHAAEYLSDLAQAWHGAETPAAATVGQQWCHQLKHQGGQAMLATLQGLDLRGRSAAARECYRATVRYVKNHLQRMDYPTYQAKGWQSGSGPVESACKRVVGQRLDGRPNLLKRRDEFSLPSLFLAAYITNSYCLVLRAPCARFGRARIQGTGI